MGILGSGLNHVFKYSSNAELFFPVFFDLDFPFINDIPSQFEKFETIIIDIKKADEDTFPSLIPKAINQLLLLFALTKIIQEDLLASEIDDLRYFLKKEAENNPSRSQIINKNFEKLSNNILDLSKNIKEKINEKIEKKKEERAA